MNTVAKLILEIESFGAVVGVKGEQIALERWKSLPSNLIDKVRSDKAEIMQVLQHDQKARKAGFLVLHSCEVYERQISFTSHVFIIKEKDKWNVWRESWKPGQTLSVSHKEITNSVSLDMALLKAKQYIERLN